MLHQPTNRRRCWSARASRSRHPSRCRPRPPSWRGETSSASPSPARVRGVAGGPAELGVGLSSLVVQRRPGWVAWLRRWPNSAGQEVAVPSSTTAPHPPCPPRRQDARVLPAHDHGGAAGGGECRAPCLAGCRLWGCHAARCTCAAGASQTCCCASQTCCCALCARRLEPQQCTPQPHLAPHVCPQVRMPLQRGEGPVGLIICPSRELARQTYDIVLEYTDALKAGGC